jgi:hypothetical protein
VNRFSVFGSVVQPDFAAGSLLGGVDDAGIEGTGVNMQADGTLIKFTRIEDPVDRLERVNGTGM